MKLPSSDLNSKIMRLSALVLALVALISGCASSSFSRSTPDWVFIQPQADAQNEYFVVSAQGTNTAEAEESAGLNLIAEIDRLLGVDVSVVSEAEIRGTLDEYNAAVRQSVTQVGSGLLAGLRIMDRYVVEDGDTVVLYVLASYEKSELQAERRKRAELVAEREDAVSVPEERAAEAESRGRFFEAFRFYVNAAVAAAGSDIRNAEVKQERNLQSAQRVLGYISMRQVAVPNELMLGQAPTEPFVVTIEGSSGGLSSVPVNASYRETVNGRSRQRSDRMQSNAAGELILNLPTPAQFGDQFVTFYLDIDAELQSLRNAGLSNSPSFNAIENLAADVRLQVSYTVNSTASTVPTAVVLLQRDIAGLPINGSGYSDGVLQQLSSQDFTIIDLLTQASELLSEGNQVLIDWVRQNYGDDVQRLVYGISHIVEVDERDGYIVKVDGELAVYDFNEGRVIARTSGIKNSRGTNSSRAVSSAFFNLGSDFGQYLINNLP